MAVIAVLSIGLLAGCSFYEQTEVRIIAIVPEHGTGWNVTYDYVVIEETKTHERHKMLGTWGNTGDVFVVSSSRFI